MKIGSRLLFLGVFLCSIGCLSDLRTPSTNHEDPIEAAIKKLSENPASGYEVYGYRTIDNPFASGPVILELDTSQGPKVYFVRAYIRSDGEDYYLKLARAEGLNLEILQLRALLSNREEACEEFCDEQYHEQLIYEDPGS